MKLFIFIGYITRDSARSVAISSWLLPLLLYFGGAEGNRRQQEVSYLYNYILLCFVSTVIWENFITISTSLAASPSSLVPRPPCPALASFPSLHAQLLSLAVRKAGRRPGRTYNVMHAAADVTYCS